MIDFEKFCNDLGSTSPIPGGGAAAGLSLTMAAACVEKAARFSEGDIAEKIVQDLDDYKKIGITLSRDDQDYFMKWQNARKLPKNTDEEKKIRTEKVNEYANECTRVPLKICESSYKLLDLIHDFLPHCNKWLISDAAIGASFCNATFESGIFNILINIPYVKDDELINKIKDFQNNKVDSFYKIYSKIINQCKKALL